jgi:Xaa-Pro aminopeptidase
MVCSNEPGYYEDGGFGIRIENLLTIEEAPTEFRCAGTRNNAQFIIVQCAALSLCTTSPSPCFACALLWIVELPLWFVVEC